MYASKALYSTQLGAHIVKRERWIRLIAGTFVMTSLALGHLVNPYFYLFTAFVGLNLFQSSLTEWCLMEDILRKIGIES